MTKQKRTAGSNVSVLPDLMHLFKKENGNKLTEKLLYEERSVQDTSKFLVEITTYSVEGRDYVVRLTEQFVKETTTSSKSNHFFN